MSIGDVDVDGDTAHSRSVAVRGAHTHGELSRYVRCAGQCDRVGFGLDPHPGRSAVRPQGHRHRTLERHMPRPRLALRTILERITPDFHRFAFTRTFAAGVIAHKVFDGGDDSGRNRADTGAVCERLGLGASDTAFQQQGAVVIPHLHGLHVGVADDGQIGVIVFTTEQVEKVSLGLLDNRQVEVAGFELACQEGGEILVLEHAEVPLLRC